MRRYNPCPLFVMLNVKNGFFCKNYKAMSAERRSDKVSKLKKFSHLIRVKVTRKFKISGKTLRKCFADVEKWIFGLFFMET